MKKFKLSVREKQCLGTIPTLVFMQSIIIVLAIFIIKAGQPMKIEDIKQVDITVDDLYTYEVDFILYRYSPTYIWLNVVANDTEYVFRNSSSFKYSIPELYDSISKGDRLSLMYYETNIKKLGNLNLVIDARTETEIYRSIEELDPFSRSGLSIVVFLILVVPLEVIFLGFLIMCIKSDANIMKYLYRRVKRHLKKRHKA